MNTVEDSKGPVSETTNRSKLTPPVEEAGQMPLNMLTGGGEEFGAVPPSFDSGRKGLSGLVLAMVLIVAVGGGGLWLMRVTGGRAPAKDQEVAKAETRINEALKRLTEKQPGVSRMPRDSIDGLFEDADKVVALFANDPTKNQIAVEDLAKNPFEIPTFKGPAVLSPDAGELARKERARKLQEELQGLKLQSVVTGAKPLAIVSGQVVRIGDTIGSFTVQSIASGGLSLVCDGRSFNLAMRLPTLSR